MAKRELSSTLKSLKFMQRAREKEELIKKEKEEQHKMISPMIGNRKCVVIMEGDPNPGAVSGRISFQNFNPSIDKINQEYKFQKFDKECREIHNTLSDTSSTDKIQMNIKRENEACMDGDDNLNKSQGNDEPEDLKRKKQKVEADSPPVSVGYNGSQSSLDRGKNTQQERGRLDWRLLRPPTGRTKRS